MAEASVDVDLLFQGLKNRGADLCSRFHLDPDIKEKFIREFGEIYTLIEQYVYPGLLEFTYNW